MAQSRTPSTLRIGSIRLSRLLETAKAALLLTLDPPSYPLYLRKTGEWRTVLPDPSLCLTLQQLGRQARHAARIKTIKQELIVLPIRWVRNKWTLKNGRTRPIHRVEQRARAGKKLLRQPTTNDAWDRPQRYQDCLPGGINAARPCPWVSCRSHLYLYVSRKGGVKPSRPNTDLMDLPFTCLNDALRAADGKMTNEAVAEAEGITHQRVSQIIKKALKHPEVGPELREFLRHNLV